MLLTDEELSIIEAEVDSHYENPMADRYEAVAKAQLKKVLEWGDESCPHIIDLGGVGTLELPKRACKKCWQVLLDEVKDA